MMSAKLLYAHMTAIARKEFNMNGQDVKDLLRRERLYQWEVAAALQISEFTLSRWLRGSLNTEREQVILQAIDKLVHKE